LKDKNRVAAMSEQEKAFTMLFRLVTAKKTKEPDFKGLVDSYIELALEKRMKSSSKL
jgi:hypothetical protein